MIFTRNSLAGFARKLTRGGTNNYGTIFKMNKDGSGYTLLHDFSAGSFQRTELVEGCDAAMYGTTGTVVYKLNKDGSGYTVLHEFTLSGAAGLDPNGLVEGSDGALYGTTGQSSQSFSSGVVFKLNEDGSGFTVLHHFDIDDGDGRYPSSALVEGSNGALYGTTTFGGINDAGTVFKLNKDGSGYMILRNFTGGADGSNPNGLVEGSDGALYGTTGQPGQPSGSQVVFKLNEDGSGFTVLHIFNASNDDEFGSYLTLVQGSDGALFGTTSYGGINRAGTVFKLSKNGSAYSVLHTFSGNPSDGAQPSGRLALGSDGALYGTTFNGGTNYSNGTVFKLNQDGSGYGVLRSFNWGGGDGMFLLGALLEGDDGALYGTTFGGGAWGRGTVFKLNQDGRTYSILHSFNEVDGDGVFPPAGLVKGNGGALYGTTARGGSGGGGTVFKLQDGGSFSVLHHFDIVRGDGRDPEDAVVEASDGALYGTTHGGGTSNSGTVFKLKQDGSGYTVLHSFTGNDSDGAYPDAALIEGNDGALYGTTSSGGITLANDQYGLGVVFKLNKDGSGYTVLHRFAGGGGDGSYPSAALLEGTEGTLYGTTLAGAQVDQYGSGVVFKLNKDGSGYRVLHRFDGDNIYDGAHPSDALVEGHDGALYGTAQSVFKVSKEGTDFTKLYWDGGGLVEGSDGALYGTSNFGGDLNLGYIFRLAPPPVIGAITLAANGVGVRFVGIVGRNYGMERSPDLRTWTPIGNATVPTNHTAEFQDGNPLTSHAFYRVVSP